MARVTALITAVLLSASLHARAQGGAVDLISILETYLRGQHDEAVARAAALPDLGPLRLRFVQDTPIWINADYSPQGVAPRGWHDVRVLVPAQPALTIKARSGYFGAP